MNNKLINQAKLKVKDKIKIINETDQKIFYEVASFKGSYNKIMKTQAPQWFKNFEKTNDERWENQIKFNSEIKASVEHLDKRMDNLEKRMDNLDKRIDNIITKNSLEE